MRGFFKNIICCIFILTSAALLSWGCGLRRNYDTGQPDYNASQLKAEPEADETYKPYEAGGAHEQSGGITAGEADIADIGDITDDTGDTYDIGDIYDIYDITEEPEPVIQPHETLRREVTIGAVGDVSLASNYNKPYVNSFHYFYDRYGAEFFFRYVREIFEQFDVSVANLEGVLSDNDDPSIRANKRFTYRGRKQYAEILRLGGIDIVSLANNHTFDYGQIGFDDTIAALQASGIGYFGNDIILIKEVNGLKLGFIGAVGSANISGSRLQTFRAQLDYLGERGADLKIVSFHWGNNDELLQNPNQIHLGRFLIDNGAHLVLGHHPHVLQGIEVYRGRYIVYSLGNFIFDGNVVSDIEHRTSIIFQITFVFEGDEIISTDVNLIPVLVSSERWRNNFQPIPVEGAMYDYILNKIAERSVF